MTEVTLFNPFGSSSKYEDRLTWAFLVTLKYDPAVQSLFRNLVAARLPTALHKCEDIWEPARISTQATQPHSVPQVLVSVLLTDELVEDDIAIRWSERDARYDGIIEYADGVTLMVENKPHHGDVWREQLSPSRKSFPNGVGGIRLHGSAICLEWSEVLEGILIYADSRMASFSNREVANDFLSFVEEFDRARRLGLTPYRTFRLCDGKPAALWRRVQSLVHELARQPGLAARGNELIRPGKIAERIYISVERPESRRQALGDSVQGWSLCVGLYPGSTTRQADRFRDAVDVEKFLSLEDPWTVMPNLNFSFMGTKLIWTDSSWTVQKYLKYFFFIDLRPYGRKNWEELSPLIEEWKRTELISSEAFEEIKRQQETNRDYLDINPEFSVVGKWDLDAIMDLEDAGTLEQSIIAFLETPLEAWGETLGQ